MIEDPPAERLRRCLVVIEESSGLPDWMQREAVMCELEDVIAIIEAGEQAAGAARTTALCGRKELGHRKDTCDRPANHDGECSWAAQRIRRLAGDYETEARKVPGLRSQVAHLTATLRKTEREMDEARLQVQAQRSARARRQAEARG
jgi:hypothetical protein